MLSTNEYHWQRSDHGEADPAFYNNTVVYPPQTSYIGWNDSGINQFKQPLQCGDTHFHPPSTSYDRSRSSNVYGDSQLWTWGASSSTESPVFNGIPFDPASTSAGSSQCSHMDATSPLSSNEFSNVPNEIPVSTRHESSSMNLHSSSLPTQSRQQSPRPVRTLYSPDFQKSREPSPTHSDSDPKRRFPCLMIGCGRRFTSQYTLKVHMEAHKPKPRVSFECTLGCSERFSRQHDRLRHEVAKHGKVCEFLCDDCGRFFSTGKTLGNHKCPVAQGNTRWVNNSG
ncbi:hypothetical protein E4T56_gene11870 [Termitomyces sp. T112]|nr:hypothetical protein E4T56_gene11870 [Termitomyces sp. T112]